MEALTLSVPPTPGNSIVRRPDNQNLFSVATIFKEKNYQPYFIYGGDGYFDNMNNFFGGQGFDIVDRNRGNPLSDDIKTQRFNIPDNEVSFENAWGICDEDLYKQSIKYADKSSKLNKPFFQFVMTTSNHKPYTFPAGKIDLPQGDRNGAVKYTDYALGKFWLMQKQNLGSKILCSSSLPTIVRAVPESGKSISISIIFQRLFTIFLKKRRKSID